MYAVGFIYKGNAGFHPCGNDGLKKLHNKTMKGWQSELQTMKRVVDEIYIMSDFTQKMCEMNEGRLWEYCERNNIARIKC